MRYSDSSIIYAPLAFAWSSMYLGRHSLSHLFLEPCNELFPRFKNAPYPGSATTSFVLPS